MRWRPRLTAEPEGITARSAHIAENMDRPKLTHAHTDPGIVEEPVGEEFSQPPLASTYSNLANRNGADERGRCILPASSIR